MSNIEMPDIESKQIPGRAFLDTCSVNFILEYGEFIFDGVQPPSTLSKHILKDIHAFYNIFLTGSRAMWQLAISPFTYKEAMETKDPSKKYYLENWFSEVWSYWVETIRRNNDLPSFIEAETMRIQLLSSALFDVLPDIDDRILICDAIVYKCDCFCTRDWKTILRGREYLKCLPIRIITPSEWWQLIKPYGALWV
ncbi:MAG: hypothetical protein ACYSSL_09400 [Planctomycetota bacterium]|jgi:hypothetical protein